MEDCQRTSFADGAFDAAFMSLVLHFTEPDATLAETRRILRPGGTLIAINLDMPALRGLDRVRSLGRVIYRGVAGYRTKPPKRFGAERDDRGSAPGATRKSRLPGGARGDDQGSVALLEHPGGIRESRHGVSAHGTSSTRPKAWRLST